MNSRAGQGTIREKVTARFNNEKRRKETEYQTTLVLDPSYFTQGESEYY